MTHLVMMTLMLLAVDEQAPAVEVTVTLESSDGYVYCALHNKPKAFPGDTSKAVATQRVKAKDKKAVCAFKKASPGVYAVAAYHDSNSNGELDTNLFGIPSEGTAATNNAKGSFGPPKFEDAKFELTSKGFKQTIAMSY
ncbi:MAG: DUF2141 domain-containing protein [Myxococcota bacterium]